MPVETYGFAVALGADGNNDRSSGGTVRPGRYVGSCVPASPVVDSPENPGSPEVAPVFDGSSVAEGSTVELGGVVVEDSVYSD